MLVSAFIILLTLITLWVVMHFIAPALLKDEHRRVHYQINEHTATRHKSGRRLVILEVTLCNSWFTLFIVFITS
ncbi:hypothetical protein ABR26_04840 [Enterobacter bugandensis]|nr:hypothetical protein ABR26_04840 [Enterobacter bugandensis]